MKRRIILLSVVFLVLSGCGEKAEMYASGGMESECGDGVDNDGDGGVDCADADCSLRPVCQGEDSDDGTGDTGSDDADSETESLYDENSVFADPSQFTPWILSFADFWEGVKDTDDGGYYTHVDVTGAPTTNTDKTVVTQSRDAWGFSRAFMISGDERYLDDAAHALQFMYEHAWDNENDGWLYNLEKDGTASETYENDRKWSFGQHYALLGLAGMVEATQDAVHRQWLMAGWNSNETHMWDDDPVLYGYYTSARQDWSMPSGKGFTPTMDGITTNVLSMYLGANHEPAKIRLGQLGENVLTHIETPQTNSAVKFGIAEEYSSEWELQQQSTYGFVGHILKTAWCLARVYLVTGGTDEEMLETASALIMDVWENGGYDHEYGAPFTSTTWNTGWVDTSQKEYWQVEQAVTSGLLNFHANTHVDQRRIFLQMAEESMQFFLDYFIDRIYGEIYLTVAPDGSVLNSTKGDTYKSAYHGIETLYYAYLYGSLFYAHTPVTLYYRFLPQSTDLYVKLTPCAVEDAKLVIDSVELAGLPYTDFDGTARTLHVAAGGGGVFKVVYRMVEGE